MIRRIFATVFAAAVVVAIGGSAAAQQLPGPSPDNPFAPGDLQNRTIFYGGSSVESGAIYADQSLGGAVLSGLTATGNNQATAYNLTSGPTAFSVVFATVPAATGVSLNANLAIGQWQLITNQGADSLTVYPPVASGGTVDGFASVPIPAGGAALIQRISASRWTSIGGSGGGGGGAIIPATTCLLAGSGAYGVAVAAPALVGISCGGAVLYGTIAATALEGNLFGVANGVATLNASAQVPIAQLNVGLGTGQILGASALGAASGAGSLTADQFQAVGQVRPEEYAVALVFTWQGTPASAQIRQQVVPFPCNLPTNLTAPAGNQNTYLTLQGWANTAPSGTDTFAVKTIHAGSPTALGNVTFATASTPTAPTSSPVSLAPGDVVQVTPSGTPTGSDYAIAIMCARTSSF